MYDFLFNNGILNISEKVRGHMSVREIYQLLRASIYDGALPVTKVIGFKVCDMEGSNTRTSISRNAAMLENNIELSKNIGELTFVSELGNIVSTKPSRGRVLSDNCEFKSDGKIIQTLGSGVYLYNSIRPVALRMVVYKNVGYHLMEENSVIIDSLGLPEGTASTYFPMNTEHSLMKYISFFPLEGDTIRYRVAPGVDEKHIQEIWNQFAKEEFEWL